MKRLFSVLLAMAMVLALAGCGGDQSGSSSDDSSGGGILDDFRGGSNSSDSSGGDSSGSDDDYDYDGFHEGRIGETLSTYWFDFTIEDAFLCSEYNGYTPADGMALLAVSMTIKNTDTATLTMWDIDFQVQWGGEGEDDFSVPVSTEDGFISDDQFPAEYDLGINQERSGVLFFEVPADYQDFAISFLEIFDDGSLEGLEGDLYAVFFTAENETDL